MQFAWFSSPMDLTHLERRKKSMWTIRAENNAINLSLALYEWVNLWRIYFKIQSHWLLSSTFLLGCSQVSHCNAFNRVNQSFFLSHGISLNSNDWINPRVTETIVRRCSVIYRKLKNTLSLCLCLSMHIMCTYIKW